MQAQNLTVSSAIVFLLARVLFGGVIAFMGLNHFMQADDLAGYAEMKGIPAPRLAVLGSGALLVAGGLSIILGVLPAVGAGLVFVFLAVTTPKMHDFWNVDDPERQQQEMTDFLKNTVIAGASLLLIAIGGASWPLAL